jgi:hypothetical protein
VEWPALPHHRSDQKRRRSRQLDCKSAHKVCLINYKKNKLPPLPAPLLHVVHNKEDNQAAELAGEHANGLKEGVVKFNLVSPFGGQRVHAAWKKKSLLVLKQKGKFTHRSPPSEPK